MRVRSIESIRNTDRDVKFNAGNSLRLLLASDGMGFSFHQTEMKKSDVVYHWHYKNHLEVCYCLSGQGELTNLIDNTIRLINPGSLYILNKHDNHTFKILEDVVLISVFNPPVEGSEIHEQDGSYPLNYTKHIYYLIGQIIKYMPMVNIIDRDAIIDTIFKQVGLNKELFNTNVNKL